MWRRGIDCPEMADVHDKKTRSFNMSRIKSKIHSQKFLLERSYATIFLVRAIICFFKLGEITNIK